MQVTNNEQIICFDVDDTLVMWEGNYNQPQEGSLPFLNPYDNSIYHLIPHKKHINLLKQMKGRGYYVRVWSAGGVQWAKAVVEKLELQEYIDIVETKPIKYVDDLTTASDILGSRIYLKHEESK